MINIISAFDLPDEKSGKRYLVERLWPRGLHRARVDIDGWLRQLAPTDALASWFQANRQKPDEFRRRYFRQLSAQAKIWQPLVEEKGEITLVYDAKHPKYGHAALLKEFLTAQKKNGAMVQHNHQKGVKTPGERVGPRAGNKVSKRQRTRRILPKIRKARISI